VLEHFQPAETGRAVAEFYRVLKPGGVLLLTTPNYGSTWPFAEGIVNCVKSLSRIPGDAHVHKMNADLLTRLASGGGFAIDRLGSFNHVSPFAAMLSERLAGRMLIREAERGGVWGNLLFCLCRKPADREREVRNG
jgi:SAM-dependent methyltransferase